MPSGARRCGRPALRVIEGGKAKASARRKDRRRLALTLLGLFPAVLYCVWLELRGT